MMPAKGMRDSINRLEEEISHAPQVECPVRHIFAHGLYAREMSMSAGTVLTGAVHKTEHINMLLKGRITVLTDQGIKELTAPYTFISRPGIKRVGYVHEDCVWMTLHKTPTTDVRALVSELTESKYEDLLGGENNRQLAYNAKESTWLSA